MQIESPVRKAERRLRDVVNDTSIQDRLMGDSHRWRQLCSSMDAIGDTELAVAAYLTSTVGDGEPGKLYLQTYGLLQVLFVQQDAVKHAAEAIDLPYSPPVSLAAIRDIRNNASGHPTERGGSRSEWFGIVRTSLSSKGFTLYSFDSERPDNHQSVQLLELIETQRAAVVDAIKQMIAHLGK